MKIRFLFIVCASAAILFIQCDPAKKIYSGEEYKGEVDTSATLADNEYDTYDSTYTGEYEGDAYDDSENTSLPDTISPYSDEIYRSSAARKNDLIHTKLEVSFDWQKAWLYGKETLTVKPYFYPTSQLILDAKGMDIKEISMLNAKEKTPLKYTYDSLQITIDLGREFKKDEEYKIFIEYVSRPNDRPAGGSEAITSDKGLYFINNDGKDKEKPMQIWTQGETESNSVWMPTIDKPDERLTEEISITVQDKYQTLSNGILVSSKQNADGTRTDYWKMDSPHAPYLFMMAIGEYAIVKDTWKGMPVNYYVEKKYEPYAKKIFGNTPQMIDFFSTVLGVKFPWPKYAQVVVRDYVSGAMENTTATLHGEFIQQTDRELLDENYEDVISHELFHSWFGDFVTCESWSNIPLNESFATYGEYLWDEKKYGRDEADYHRYEQLQQYQQQASNDVSLIRYNYSDREEVFDATSYQKGGAVLNMLRKYVGDDAFFASLNKYLNDNRFKSVEIQNLRLAFEETTGEDLSWFFNEWFLNSGNPDLNIIYGYDEISGTEEIQIQQLQQKPAPIYKIPVDVDIYVNGKPERYRIILDRPDQTFTFKVSSKPDLVNFDAENMLIGTRIENLSTDEYVFQYNNCHQFQDRYDAVQWLGYEQQQDAKAYAVIVAALSDKFWAIRKAATDTILLTDASEATKNKIIDMALNDKKSAVRVAAINRLTDLENVDIKPVLTQALKDSSYAVVASAITLLYDYDKQMAVDVVRKYIDETNLNMQFTVWDILSRESNPKDNDYFLAMFDKYKDYRAYYEMIYYIPYLQNQKDSYIIERGVDKLHEIATDPNRNWISYFADSYIASLKEYYNTNMSSQDAATREQWQLSVKYIDDVLSKMETGND